MLILIRVVRKRGDARVLNESGARFAGRHYFVNIITFRNRKDFDTKGAKNEASGDTYNLNIKVYTHQTINTNKTLFKRM